MIYVIGIMAVTGVAYIIMGAIDWFHDLNNWDDFDWDLSDIDLTKGDKK